MIVKRQQTRMELLTRPGIEQRTEEEKEEAFKAKTQLFQDKRHKEREIKALQVKTTSRGALND